LVAVVALLAGVGHPIAAGGLLAGGATGPGDGVAVGRPVVAAFRARLHEAVAAARRLALRRAGVGGVLVAVVAALAGVDDAVPTATRLVAGVVPFLRTTAGRQKKQRYRRNRQGVPVHARSAGRTRLSDQGGPITCTKYGSM